jgi:hypothetical protein
MTYDEAIEWLKSEGGAWDGETLDGKVFVSATVGEMSASVVADSDSRADIAVALVAAVEELRGRPGVA